jgi:hypothetical protein
VDVVDEQLDVARVSQKASQDTHRGAHADEDEEVGKRVPVAGPETALEQVEQTDVGGADQAADEAGDDDVREQPPLLPQEPFDEELARAWKVQAAGFHKYSVVRI